MAPMPQHSCFPYLAMVIGTHPEIINLAPIMRMLESRAGCCTAVSIPRSCPAFPCLARRRRNRDPLRHRQSTASCSDRPADRAARRHLLRLAPGGGPRPGRHQQRVGRRASKQRRLRSHRAGGSRVPHLRPAMPEELNRCVVGVLADLHCASTSRSPQGDHR